MIVGLIKTLLIFAAIYYVGKLLARYVFPLVLRNYVNKMTGQNGSRYHESNQKKRREGEVNLNKRHNKKKRIPKSEGEYIDFEEVKE